MEQTQNIEQYCLQCKYNVLDRFKKEEITLKQARAICANCKFGKAGIYKFDIVFSLADTAEKLADTNEKLETAKKWRQNTPKGKKDTYTKRYGTAVKQLQEEGKTVRQIAEILGISPTTIVKITKKQNNEEESST